MFPTLHSHFYVATSMPLLVNFLIHAFSFCHCGTNIIEFQGSYLILLADSIGNIQQWRDEMKVCAFNGSPRPKGNTYLLLSIVLEEMKRKGSTRNRAGRRETHPGVHGLLSVPYEKEPEVCVDTDRFNDHFAKMVEADGILLGTPTYFSDVSAWMKALIERAGS